MKTRLIFFLAKKGGYSIPALVPVLLLAELTIAGVSYLKGRSDGEKK